MNEGFGSKANDVHDGLFAIGFGIADERMAIRVEGNMIIKQGGDIGGVRFTVNIFHCWRPFVSQSPIDLFKYFVLVLHFFSSFLSKLSFFLPFRLFLLFLFSLLLILLFHSSLNIIIMII